jgi:chaperonin GroEL
MGEKVLQNKELKKKILEGVNLIGDVVSSTLGPMGHLVLIDNNGDPYVTKDGVTVAKSMYSDDPVVNSVMGLIKQTAEKTVKDAGDGTSTSIVLAKSLINNGFENLSEQTQLVDFFKGIDFAAEIVSEKIRSISRKIETSESARNVAHISSNGDYVVSDIIYEALNEVGLKGTIHVVKNSTGKTFLDVTKGFKFNKGIATLQLLDKSGKTEIRNPWVIIYNGDLMHMEPILEPLQDLYEEQGCANVLLIAHTFGGSVLDSCISNRNSGILNIYPVEAPSFGTNRNAILEDICTLCSNTPDLPSTITEPVYGQFGKVIITKDTTTLFEGFGSDTNVASRIEKLESEISDTEDIFAVQVLKERISNLKNNVATLYIGGLTEADINERADRIEDAVCAVQSAIEEGITPGGGKTYLICQDHLDALEFNGLDVSSDFYLGYKTIKDSLFAPFEKLMENSGFNGDYSVEKLYEGIDFRNNSIVNLWDSGIIDSAKASRVAFENAVAIAKIILNTNSYVRI